MARARAAPLVVLSLFCGALDASPVFGRNGVTHLGPHDTNLLTTGTGMTTKMKMKTKTKLNPMWEEGGHCEGSDACVAIIKYATVYGPDSTSERATINMTIGAACGAVKDAEKTALQNYVTAKVDITKVKHDHPWNGEFCHDPSTFDADTCIAITCTDAAEEATATLQIMLPLLDSNQFLHYLELKAHDLATPEDAGTMIGQACNPGVQATLGIPGTVTCGPVPYSTSYSVTDVIFSGTAPHLVIVDDPMTHCKADASCTWIEPRQRSCRASHIPNSNRTAALACSDVDVDDCDHAGCNTGHECNFACNAGYIPIGRHVCQWRSVDWLKYSCDMCAEFSVTKLDGTTITVTSTELRDMNKQIPFPYNKTIAPTCVSCKPGSDPLALPKHGCCDMEQEDPTDPAAAHHGFFGGRCARLCSGLPAPLGQLKCAATQSVRRFKWTDDEGACLATMCFESKDANLKNQARGIYEAFADARIDSSGFYFDNINIPSGQEKHTDYTDAHGGMKTSWNETVSLDATAMGIMVETIAAALEFIPTCSALERVTKTLSSLNGIPIPHADSQWGSLRRDHNGFFSHFSAMNTSVVSIMSSGIIVAAAQFVKNYFVSLPPEFIDPKSGFEGSMASDATAECGSASPAVAALVQEANLLFAETDFTKMLCDGNPAHDGSNSPYKYEFLSPMGTGITLVKDAYDDRCMIPSRPHGTLFPNIGDFPHNETFHDVFNIDEDCRLHHLAQGGSESEHDSASDMLPPFIPGMAPPSFPSGFVHHTAPNVDDERLRGDGAEEGVTHTESPAKASNLLAKQMDGENEYRNCYDCDAGGNCGICLMAIPEEECAESHHLIPLCSDSVGVGELCEGYSGCGTKWKLNNCGFLTIDGSYDIYRRFDCVVTPHPPPLPESPPPPPWSPGLAPANPPAFPPAVPPQPPATPPPPPMAPWPPGLAPNKPPWFATTTFDGAGIEVCLKGTYEFSEIHLAAYLAFEQACGEQEYGRCMCDKEEIPSCREGDHHPIEAMWLRWQKHRLHPDHHFADVSNMLNGWGAYIVQMLYYTTSTFSTDQFYLRALEATRLGDLKFFKDGFYAGKRGRYGTTEGPTDSYCSGFHQEYDAMYMPTSKGALTPGYREGMYKHRGTLTATQAHCYAYSANAVAGYMPSSSFVEGQVLQLLEDGEAVVAMPQSDSRPGNGRYSMLWRQSVSDPTIYHKGLIHITMVDAAPAFLGLSTLWLPEGFFQKYGTLSVSKQEREVALGVKQYLSRNHQSLEEFFHSAGAAGGGSYAHVSRHLEAFLASAKQR